MNYLDEISKEITNQILLLKDKYELNDYIRAYNDGVIEGLEKALEIIDKFN